MRRVDHSDERGSVSVLVAVLAIAFLMVAGLALDGGRSGQPVRSGSASAQRC
jgi:hypothetical protein